MLRFQQTRAQPDGKVLPYASIPTSLFFVDEHDECSAYRACFSRRRPIYRGRSSLSGGVERGEAVIAVASKRNLGALQAELGSQGRYVDLFDNADWYDSQARTLHRYLRYWNERNETGLKPLRILGEPIKPAHCEEDVRRWTAFENGINDLIRSMPVRMLCAYDLSIQANTEHNVEVSHPHMAHGESTRASSRYVEPHSFSAQRASLPLPVPHSGVSFVPFSGATLCALREALAGFAARAALDRTTKIDLFVAIGEAVANAVRHGGGEGMLRIWRDEREIVADVISYEGRFENVMHGYVPPPQFAESGRGLWVVRQICEWVEIRPRSSGSIVRMHFRTLSPMA